jgi:signal transduction histidine kinase
VTDRRRVEAELRAAHRMIEASRDQLRLLADEQAALRRVATLLAQERPPAEVFAAVAEEVRRVVQVEDTRIVRTSPTGRPPSWRARAAPPATSRPPSARRHRRGAALGRRAGGVPHRGRIAARGRGADRPTQPLVGTAISNVQARSDLAASRARLAAAADEERRRVVRDLHDGAQQRLVNTVVTLKLAGVALEEGDAMAPELVAEALRQAERANVELRELAHGILPAALTRGGLRAGVDALASRMPVPVALAVDVDRLPRRSRPPRTSSSTRR